MGLDSAACIRRLIESWIVRIIWLKRETKLLRISWLKHEMRSKIKELGMLFFRITQLKSTIVKTGHRTNSIRRRGLHGRKSLTAPVNKSQSDPPSFL
jgi:hypothetical protein